MIFTPPTEAQLRSTSSKLFFQVLLPHPAEHIFVYSHAHKQRHYKYVQTHTHTLPHMYEHIVVVTTKLENVISLKGCFSVCLQPLWKQIRWGSFLGVEVGGTLSDTISSSPFSSEVTLPQLCSCLKKAAHDPRIAGIYLKVRPYCRAGVRTGSRQVYRFSGTHLMLKPESSLVIRCVMSVLRMSSGGMQLISRSYSFCRTCDV
jgi:hypothetical protein